MFKKRKKAERAPESRTAYLTTIDGAFTDNQADEDLIDQSAGSESEDERYEDTRVRGEHDAAGKAGAPKGSIRFGEGNASSPRYFSMDPKSGDHLGDPVKPAQPPVNYDMVDDIEQRIIDAAGNRSADGAAHDDRAVRARGSLIFATVLAVILALALVVCVFMLLAQAAQAETQQTSVGGTAADSAQTTSIVDSDDESSTSKQTTVVPVLSNLIGSTEKQALTKLGHGAQVSRTKTLSGEDTQAVKRLKVVLTNDASSDGIGSPIVYLDLNDQDAVVAVSYKVGMKSLGYGDLSFKQAVGKAKVIQQTLTDAGINVADDSAIALPKNRKSYTTYKTDKKTLTKQSITFTGSGTAAGMDYRWTGTITYDYSKANNSANLANTRRVIQVGISI
ncbi:MAG: hypothetical protein ACOX1O_08490 [Eggerthellaceae bacterium]